MEVDYIVELALKAKLGKKISEASKEIGSLNADGSNTDQGYNFISSDNVEFHINPILEKSGICIIPDEKSFKNENGLTSKGKRWDKTTVDIEFEILDNETGYSIKKNLSGVSVDFGGKDHSKAITEATKRFYIKLFHISVKNDSDLDGDSESGEIEPEKQSIEGMEAQAESIKKMKAIGWDKSGIEWTLRETGGDPYKIDIFLYFWSKYKDKLSPDKILRNYIPFCGWDRDQIEDCFTNPPPELLEKLKNKQGKK